MTHHPKRSQPRRRIILNCDGEPREMFAPPPVDWDALVENNVEVLTGTHVDTLFWGMGTGYVFIHDTKIGEFLGDHSDGFRSLVLARLRANARSLIEQGRDTLGGIVEAGHARGLEVFASLRMNDLHDSQEGDQLGKLKRDHPEYLIGEAANVYAGGRPYKYSAMTGFDFSVPAVRDFKLAVVRDTLERYDVDGIELDWTRNPAAFKPGEELANLGALNELTRQVRACVDETARRRQRPAYLAASVPGPLSYCRQLGMDVRSWLSEGLLDIVTINGPAFGVTVGEYVELTRQVGCQLFARMIRHPRVFSDPDTVRATAATYWLDGADGIYFFNCWGREGTRAACVHEVGDPQVLDRLDKHYVVAQRPDPFPPVVHTVIRQPEANEPLPVHLHVTAGDRGAVVPLKVADDVEAAAADGVLGEVALEVRLENWDAAEDELLFRLNGETLPEPAVRAESVQAAWLAFPLDGPPLRQGLNELEAVLRRRNRDLIGPLALTDVELIVRYV